jgi:3-phenylpropionate/trans-cinnamate dioxygenase ferredoxin reductase subunit
VGELTMSDARTFVIVGAGQAGRWLALTLRADGFAGRIVLLGEEPHRPYDRPPLSKAALKGEVAAAQLALIPEAQFDTLRLDWRPGECAVAIDRAARTVRTASGESIGYDALFLANGGRARELPGLAPHPRIATLRTYEDALAIRRRILDAEHVLVIGGGWIGLEVAASARSLGRRVTLVEAAPRLCIRTVPACVSAHLEALHRAQGVALRLGDGVSTVDATDRHVTVVLASGERIAADCLVVGIGLVANDGLAAAAGLAAANGVLTDASGRTDDAAIYAVGDVANALRGDGRRLRIESWENAQRQAVAAAKAALGLDHDVEAAGPPWFWSDQFDDNLQLLGIPDESMRVVERAVPAKRQRVFYFCEGRRVRAVAAVNAGREIKVARKWMLQDRYPEPEALADASVDANKLPLAAA